MKKLVDYFIFFYSFLFFIGENANMNEVAALSRLSLIMYCYCLLIAFIIAWFF